MPDSTRRIAIVGAGCSGTLLAAQLLRQARVPVEVALVERNPGGFGLGVAYGTRIRGHLLNVPAERMGAYPGEPTGFLEWARSRPAAEPARTPVPPPVPGAFLPRMAFGAYLRDVLAEAEGSARPGIRLVRHEAEAVRLERSGPAWSVVLAGGGEVEAEEVALALGNFPPGDPALPDLGFLASDSYHGNPWAPGALERVARTRICLLLGSGLTMADWVIGLEDLGYRGRIWTLSRRGLQPQAHRPAPPGPDLQPPASPPRTARGWLRWIRASSTGPGGWRAAVDALRASTPAIWRDLGVEEQRRFLRHLRPYWDAHRHRMPEEVAARLEALRSAGRLVGRAGRLSACRATEAGLEVDFQPRGAAGTETLLVDAMVNCMGSESDYRRLDSSLVRSLLDAGLATTDAHHLGLATAADGQVLGRDGLVPGLFTLGPARKGQAWETTAVPEIRVQAEALAARLLRR